MNDQNRFATIFGWAVLGIGWIWIIVIAHQMHQAGLFPWQQRTVKAPVGCDAVIVYSSPPPPNAPTCTKDGVPQ